VKFKLDENISRRGVELLRSAGHDALTVRDEGLAGADDEEIYAVASSEGRTLITLDYDLPKSCGFRLSAARVSLSLISVGAGR